MPEFRRGAAALSEAVKRDKAKGSGEFRPFVPEIFWPAEDGYSRYLLFLNEMNDIPTVDMINFIPVKKKKANGESFTVMERTIARTDPSIGEDEDPMQKEWDGKPKATCVAVAVELVPTVEEDEKGRKRPTGFEIAMTEFDRRVRDEDGELTDETETVEAPVVGFVHASPHNFFNVVQSYDEDEAPIEATPLKITRVGTDSGTTYTVVGYREMGVDLGPLIEYIDGVSYLGDDADELIEQVDEIDDDQQAALLIGEFLLDKRLAELVDQERYDDLLEGITESLDKFGSKKKKGGDKKTRERGSRRERPARGSQRRSRSEDPEPDAEPEADAPADEPEPEEKPKRRSRTRAKAKEEAPADDEPKEDAKPKGDGNAKLKELRERQAKRKAA